MLTGAKGRMALLVLVVAAVLAVVLGGSVVTAQGPADIRSVVIFEEGTFDTQAADRALEAVGAARIKTIDRASMAVVYLPSQAALAGLSRQPGVVRVERDIVVHATGSAAGGAPAVLKKPPWAGGPSKDGGSDTPPQSTPWGVEAIHADPSSNAAGGSTGDGINVAVLDAGILIVAAAGNDGGAVGYPAAYPGVIAVAATNSSDTAPSWSSRGDGKGDDEVELAAPGVGIPSTYKDGAYETLSGTSMASPHVAGSAALVWAANSGWDAAAVRDALTGGAKDLGVDGWDLVYGWGLVQPWGAAQ